MCKICEALKREGTTVAFRLSIRGLVFGAASMAVVAAPLALGMAGQQSSHALADCGGINYTIFQEGTPVNNCAAPAAPPVNTGGAPSEGTLSACSGIPGCLSNTLYGPGNVIVPRPDTTVHQSQ
jgi:hypothetical protein